MSDNTSVLRYCWYCLTQKDILKKLGGGSAGSSQAQLMLYNTIKSLLERVAPVMVDSSAISVLVKHIDDAVKGQGTISDGILKAGEKGAHLLLVIYTYSIFYLRRVV